MARLGSMRWERLFADLEAQLEGELRRDLDAEVADRTRRELAQVDLGARLSAQVGSSLTLTIRTGAVLSGDLRDIGADWLLLESGRGEALVPLGAVIGFSELGTRARGDRTARRFGFGYAARLLARDRAAVQVTDLSGARRTGTIDRVGADFFDLAEHASGEVRRTVNVLGRRTLPFSAVVMIQSS